jgi:hypothetical protein
MNTLEVKFEADELEKAVYFFENEITEGRSESGKVLEVEIVSVGRFSMKGIISN